MPKSRSQEVISTPSMVPSEADERARVARCTEKIAKALEEERCILATPVHFTSGPDNWIRAVPTVQLVAIRDEKNGHPK